MPGQMWFVIRVKDSPTHYAIVGSPNGVRPRRQRRVRPAKELRRRLEAFVAARPALDADVAENRVADIPYDIRFLPDSLRQLATETGHAPTVTRALYGDGGSVHIDHIAGVSLTGLLAKMSADEIDRRFRSTVGLLVEGRHRRWLLETLVALVTARRAPT